MTNIVTAPIGANRMTKTRSIYQYNYGQVLVLTGIELPPAYEVHFSNSEFGVSKVQVGNADGVTIPDEYLESGADIYAWLYLHTGADDGETVYKILIPVEKRASISPEEPTPVQQDAITQAIAALNDAVDRTAQDVIDADSSAQAAQQSAEDAQQAAQEAESAAAGSVHFDVEQTLTAEEKARARENIGAASGSDIPTGTVRYDEAQTLTDTETAQARRNISAAFAGDVAKVQQELTEYNSVKLCDDTTPSNNTSAGVTFTWTGNSKCLATGTPTGNAKSFSFARTDDISQAGLVDGGTYFLHLKSPAGKVKAQITFAKTTGGSYMIDTQTFTADSLFTIPTGYNSLSAALYVENGTGYVWENVECGIYSAPTNKQLFENDGNAITDVQVNGTSIAFNKVANVPIAGSNLGVVKVDASYGITANSAGRLATSGATDAAIKSGANGYTPIVPARQHQAAFYGFAKAAGDTTQAASANPVGTYTDEAKAAIQQMLGVDGMLSYAEDQDLTEEQREQARNNIDAASLVQVDEEITDLWDAVDGKVTDVQVNGTSVVTDGVANVPGGGYNKLGVIKLPANSNLGGLATDSTSVVYVDRATGTLIKEGANRFRPITPDYQHAAAFYGFAKAAGDTTQSASSNAVGTYTETAKSKISDMLNSPVSVTGTTPTITALSGIQYVCGEVATLDITLPASGIVDVVFQSGSTPTVLTVTPQTGMTVEWANGFDPTSLEANTTYELNIKDGLGVAVGWT